MTEARFKADATWNDAIALVRANREIAGAIAGIFLFLPMFAFGLLGTPLDMVAMSKENPLVRVAAMGAFLRANWGWIVFVPLCSWLAALAINVHVSDTARPTVKDALVTALRLLPFYVLAQLLSMVAIFFIANVIMLPSAFLPQILSGIFAMLAIGCTMMMAIAWAPLGAVIAVERLTNPVAALRRSWQLTKGHKARFGVFIVFVAVMTFILQYLFAILFSLPLLLLPPEIKLPAMTMVAAFMQSTATIFLLFVLLASYRQLVALQPK